MRRGGLRAAAVLSGALLFAQQPALAVEVRTLESVRLNVRVRTPLPGDRSRNWFTGDLEVLPVLQAALWWSRTQLTLRLNPSLLLREPHLRGPLYPLAAGQVQLTTRGDRWDLTVLQSGAWGTQDVGTLRNPDGSLPTGVPEVQTLGAVPYLRSGTSVLLNDAPTARTAFSLAAGYLVQGNPDPTNTTLPLQYGPTGQARFRYRLTRPDWLSTTAQVSQSTFATGQLQFISMLTQSWDRSWSTTVSSSLGAGVALTKERIVAIPGGALPGDYQELLPVVFGYVGTRQHLAQQALTFGVSGRMAPFPDRFTGAVYERLEGSAQVQWLPERTLTIAPNAGFAWAVPVGRAVQAGDRLFFVEGTVTWWALPWLGLAAYSRLALVSQPRLGIDNQLQWVATLSVVLQDQRSFTW